MIGQIRATPIEVTLRYILISIYRYLRFNQNKRSDNLTLRITPNSDYNDADSETVSRKRNKANSTSGSNVNLLRRVGTKYSLKSEAGRKNILLLALISMVLVSNFNQQRDTIKGSLGTDLDQILSENRSELSEMLSEMEGGEMHIGINDLNSGYLDIDRGGSPSVVKMNGLVPFVARNLPFSRGQEDTLYEYCLKYANVNIAQNCSCPAEEGPTKPESMLRKRSRSRHSRKKRRTAQGARLPTFSKYYEEMDSDDDYPTSKTNEPFSSQYPQLEHKPDPIPVKTFKRVKHEATKASSHENVPAPRPLTYKSQSNQDLQALIFDSEDTTPLKSEKPFNPKHIIEFIKPVSSSNPRSSPIPTPLFGLNSFTDTLTREVLKSESRISPKNRSALRSILKEDMSIDETYTCKGSNKHESSAPSQFKLVLGRDAFRNLENGRTYFRKDLHMS